MNTTIKYIIGVLVGVALIVPGLNVLSGDNTKQVSGNESVVTVNKITHDFGDIDIFGGKVSTDYTLTNEGTEDVQIENAVTSCMCTIGEIDGFEFGMHGSSGEPVVIPAGESKVLTATFDPLAHGPAGTGKIKRELVLKTNSTETPEIKVTLTANVVKGTE